MRDGYLEERRCYSPCVGYSVSSDRPITPFPTHFASNIYISGLGIGILTGLIGWPLLRRYALCPKKWGHQKYHFFNTLVAGAFGSFLGSIGAGRESVQVVFADIFHGELLYINDD